MKYRNLGKTGLTVSEIGLGCEHLDGKPYKQTKATINAALDSGVNILDCFMPGTEIRENIAKALDNSRSDVIIQGAICSSDLRQQYDISRDITVVRKYFEEMLKIFGYVDIAMLFIIDSDKDFTDVFETEIIEYALALKQKGDIRHIGFSSHNPATARRIVETDIPEVMFFSLNPAFDMMPPDAETIKQVFEGFDPSLINGIDPTRAELYKLCDRKNIGITAMKTLGGGKLISKEHTPFTKPLTVQQCTHYALTRPAVASVMLGCQSAAEVEETLKYYTVSDNKRDFAEIMGSMRNDFKGSCVYCGHCQPCPSNIGIAAVMKQLDIVPYTPLASVGECVDCGSCEERCPFGVPIRQRMREAKNV